MTFTLFSLLVIGLCSSIALFNLYLIIIGLKYHNQVERPIINELLEIVHDIPDYEVLEILKDNNIRFETFLAYYERAYN